MSSTNRRGEDAGRTQTLSEAAPESARSLPRIALLFYRGAKAEIALLEPGTPLVVGRAPAVGLTIDDRSLSREHARFELAGGRVYVDDLGSKNGTFSLGRRVQRAALDLGDEATIGWIRVRVQPLGISGESLGIDGEDAFRRHVDEELARAAQFRRPFALLLVRALDLRSSEANLPAERAVSWLEALRGRLRPVDRIAAYGCDAAQVLLPETSAGEAARIAAAICAPLLQGELRLLAGVAAYPDAACTGDGLVERSRQALRRASAAHPVELAVTPAWKTDASAEEAIVVGAVMSELFATIGRVASSRLPVILHGETGTGKEVIACRIHELGPRRAQHMTRVNCGAIPKELVESTLFGHERGAFTGAVQRHHGVFEEAAGGTVFLDEIGELSLPAQAALLRVLETGSFCRVGSAREIVVNVRIVVATNQDLEAMVGAGAFRADLYYRLSGIVLEIPPLRERKDEIEPLARRFLRLANEANSRRVEGITQEAMDLLMAHSWPGNVRELRNAIERAVVVTPGALIGPPDLPARVRAVKTQTESVSEPVRASTSSPSPPSPPAPSSPPRDTPSSDAPARDRLQQYEGNLLRDTLEATDWNRAEAAQRLGLPLRTLSHRMKLLGIKKPLT